MKRLFLLLIVLILLPCFALSDDLPRWFPKDTDTPSPTAAPALSASSDPFTGGWVMYADRGQTIYHFTLTFLQNDLVVLHSLVFDSSGLKSDNTASGEWIQINDSIILFTLAGQDMQGHINDDGILFIGEYGAAIGSGAFVRCPDMGYTIQVP